MYQAERGSGGGRRSCKGRGAPTVAPGSASVREQRPSAAAHDQNCEKESYCIKIPYGPKFLPDLRSKLPLKPTVWQGVRAQSISRTRQVVSHVAPRSLLLSSAVPKLTPLTDFYKVGRERHRAAAALSSECGTYSVECEGFVMAGFRGAT